MYMLHQEIQPNFPLKGYEPPYTNLMDEPYQHATLFTFLHSAVHNIPSENTANNQDVEYTPTKRMANTCYSLISYFKWKTNTKKNPATSLWPDHIKAPLTTLILSLHGLQIWPKLPSTHLWLLLLITLNTHILFHHIRIPSDLNLLYISLNKFNLYLRLESRIQPLKLAMKPHTITLWKPIT